VSGAELSITMPDIGEIELHFSKLTGPVFAEHLLEKIGALVESQTRRRIEVERTFPSGSAWPEWSPKYAKTRHENQELLFNEGNLDDSITFEPVVDFAGFGNSYVEVGSNLRYAASHQYGDPDRNIPARTYLGLGAENTRELDEMVTEYIGGLL
jgi:phage virion morphogenesis protein